MMSPWRRSEINFMVDLDHSTVKYEKMAVNENIMKFLVYTNNFISICLWDI